MTRSAFLEAMRSAGQASISDLEHGARVPFPAVQPGDRWLRERLKACLETLRRVLLRRGNSSVETEDLIQEAFLRMQEYCEKGGEVRTPEGFLMRTALRLAANARRDAHRELYAEGADDDLAQLVDCTPRPDEVLAGHQSVCYTHFWSVFDPADAPMTRGWTQLRGSDSLSPTV